MTVLRVAVLVVVALILEISEKVLLEVFLLIEQVLNGLGTSVMGHSETSFGVGSGDSTDAEY